MLRKYVKGTASSGSEFKITLVPVVNGSSYIVIISGTAFLLNYYNNAIGTAKRFVGDSDPNMFDSFVVENGYLKIKTTTTVSYGYVACWY